MPEDESIPTTNLRGLLPVGLAQERKTVLQDLDSMFSKYREIHSLEVSWEPPLGGDSLRVTFHRSSYGLPHITVETQR